MCSKVISKGLQERSMLFTAPTLRGSVAALPALSIFMPNFVECLLLSKTKCIKSAKLFLAKSYFFMFLSITSEFTWKILHNNEPIVNISELITHLFIQCLIFFLQHILCCTQYTAHRIQTNYHNITCVILAKVNKMQLSSCF